MKGTLNTAQGRKAMTFLSVILCLTVSGLNQSAAGDRPKAPCMEANGIKPICKLHNPEDLMVVPGTKKLIVSQIGHVGEARGSLALVDTETEEVSLLYPQSQQKKRRENMPLWGEKSCTKPAEYFSPIGIGMTARDGRTELLVGNFGPEKSIQMFEVMVDEQTVSLEWRGCVMAPPHTYFGDVAGLSEGGFVVTASTPRKEDWNKDITEVDWKKAKGMLMSWRPEEAEKGLLVSVTDTPFNSVEASPDGKYAFATKVEWKDGGVHKFSLETGKLLGKARIVQTDNVTWDEEGYLITVSPVTVGWEETVACGQNSHTFCPIPTTVTRVNPETLETKLVFAHDGKSVFGGGTGGAQLGDYLYLGATAGDRIARIAYDR